MSNQNTLLPTLAATSGGGLTITTGPQRIATRMAENLLDVARSQERALAAQRRYRIGDYEFREADYAQIQRWARMLGMAAVLDGLASSQQADWFDGSVTKFCVEDGAIVSLVWDFNFLPLTNWEWEQGLQIAYLGILNAPLGTLPILPRCLHELLCDHNQLTSLALAQVPKLKKLDCSSNQLIVLDLMPIPKLEWLNCSSNPLNELNLTPVLELKGLSCYRNQLTELNLTSVPRLQELTCEDNHLIELDLTPVQRLQYLNCAYNQMTELDLTLVPALQALDCSHNWLTTLDLTPVPGLQTLWCDASLNITGASPNLKVFHR